MRKNHLTVIARLVAKAGKESELRMALQELVAPTRAEAGCIQYDLHESNEKQGMFFFYETWTSSEALANHFTTPHILSLQSKSKELLAEPLELHQLTLISHS